MAIQGLRDTSNFVANARPQNWREGILLLYPNGKTPLLGLTSVMKKRETDDIQFNWWEKQLDDRRFELHASNGDLTASNTTLVLAAGSNARTLRAGDVLLVEQTREQLFVTADPSTETAVQVLRGWAGTTPATLDANGAGINPHVMLIGSAFEEASMAPTGVNYDPTQFYNYTQIFRDTLEASRTAMKTRLRTGDSVREAKRECLEYHGIAIERALWHGERSSSVRNGKPQHTMRGIEKWIPNDNIKTANTTDGVDMEQMEEYLFEMFKYGSSEKVGFCGNRALLTLNQIVRKNGKMNIQSGIKEFGMNVSRLTSPFGEIVLKSHPLFNQIGGGTTTAQAYYGLESWLVVLDMENIKYVHMKDSDTKYQPDLTPTGMDGMKSGYLTECSLEVHHGKTHYMIKNLAKAKVDDDLALNVTVNP